MLDISVIILTYNEELHIRRCLENAGRFAKEIFVVDSFSTDATVRLAEEMGARVFSNKWVNYATQFNWALAHLPITTRWVWRMDADEYLSDELIDELHQRLPASPPGVNAYTAPCRRIFMGRYIRHGIIPLILLRLFRTGCAQCENRQMDEHIRLGSGSVGELRHPFYDHNLNGLTWWTAKHNGYATREAADLLLTEYGMADNSLNSGRHTARVRRGKLLYTRLPLFFRAFALFCYRYFVRLGFLDGREGFLWHFLQGFWYRALADAKVYETKKRLGFDRERIRQYLGQNYAPGATAQGPDENKER